MEGFHLRGASAAFEQWLEGERRRLRALASAAARSLAEDAERAGDADAARSWARRGVELAPLSDEAHAFLIELFDRTGDRAGALAAHAAYAQRLEAELGASPSAAVEAAVARVRRRPPVTAGKGRPDARRVAVLPFDVATGASAADAFATGLHLDVLTTLARDPALTVISRRSLARGSGPADGRALGAGTIVEGVVREEGGRVRLTVQVVDGQDGRVRWAETLDRDLSAEGAFDLQAEIADRIAETVHGEVAAPAGRPGGSPPPPDLDAYLLRTRGRVHLEQRTERGLRRALALFGEATELATESAAAWAGIAEARALLGYYGYAAPDEGPDALAAALQALELDPSSGDALRALGVVRSVRQEGPAAARAFARAVERSPGDGDAQCWLGWIRLILGEPAGAIGPSERAAELDPLAPPVRVYLAEAYLANGRAEDAVREARRAGELQPDYGLTHFTEEVALHHAGRHGDATAALGEALVLARVGGGAPGRADVEGALAVARAAAGDEEGAHLLREGLGGTGVPAALALAALGDVEGALRALDGVTEWSALATVQLRYLFPHALCRVRQDDRFDRIVDRIDAAWGRPTTASALESGRS